MCLQEPCGTVDSCRAIGEAEHTSRCPPKGWCHWRAGEARGCWSSVAATTTTASTSTTAQMPQLCCERAESSQPLGAPWRGHSSMCLLEALSSCSPCPRAPAPLPAPTRRGDSPLLLLPSVLFYRQQQKMNGCSFPWDFLPRCPPNPAGTPQDAHGCSQPSQQPRSTAQGEEGERCQRAGAGE